MAASRSINFHVVYNVRRSKINITLLAVNRDCIVGGLWPGEGLQAESADWCRPNSSTSLGTRLRIRCGVR